MEHVTLTKTEFKKQKDQLKRFNRFLPILKLKKERLQQEIQRIEKDIREVEQESKKLVNESDQWIGLTAQDQSIKGMFSVARQMISSVNIAGVDLPVFQELKLNQPNYDLFEKSLWFDAAVAAITRLLTLDAKQDILKIQQQRVTAELRRATQRVNLFEKVKIPETEKAIRRIRIYLGDQQIAAVVRGKISKKKLRHEGDQV